MLITHKFSTYKAVLFIFISALFPFFAFIQMNILNVMGEQIGQELALNATDISLLSAIYLYADAIMLLPAGILLDRFSTKHLFFIGLGLIIIGIFIFANLHHLWIACLGRFLAGCGHAFALLGCFRLIGIYFPSHRQGFMIGAVITIALLGGLVAQSPYALLIQAFGWRPVLFMQSGLGIIIGLLIGATLPAKMPISVSKISGLWKDLKIASHNKQNWLASFYTALMGTPLMILGALWGSNYLITNRGVTSLQAASVISMIFIGTIIGSPLIGFISDRVNNRRRVMFYGALLTLCTLILIHQFHSTSLLYLMAVFFLLGLFGSSQVLGYPVINDSNSKETISTAMGFSNVLIMVIIASSQLLFGWLWNNFTTQFYALGYMVLSIIISAFISIKLKEPFIEIKTSKLRTI